MIRGVGTVNGHSIPIGIDVFTLASPTVLLVPSLLSAWINLKLSEWEVVVLSSNADQV